MLEAFSAAGFFVHTPWGPRKSGIRESVEIPAPVSTATRSAASISVAATRTASSMARFSSLVPSVLTRGTLVAVRDPIRNRRGFATVGGRNVRVHRYALTHLQFP